MKINIALLVLFCLAPFLVAKPAVAQVADDVMALVFDLEANWPYDQSNLYAPVTVYLVLSKPSYANLYGFEAAIRSADGELLVSSSSVENGGVDSLEDQSEFAVSYDVPLATTAITLLATIQVFPIHSDECLILTGITNPSLNSQLPLIWPSPGSPRPIETNDMFANGVDAVVSGSMNPVLIEPWYYPCSLAVANSATSWGALKAQYR